MRGYTKVDRKLNFGFATFQAKTRHMANGARAYGSGSGLIGKNPPGCGDPCSCRVRHQADESA
jgi:hypothetical protein